MYSRYDVRIRFLLSTIIENAESQRIKWRKRQNETVVGIEHHEMPVMHYTTGESLIDTDTRQLEYITSKIRERMFLM